MCFFSSPPVPAAAPVPPAPTRAYQGSQQGNLRALLFRSRGVNDTLFTSPLGDTGGFGTFAKKATFLGQSGTQAVAGAPTA